MMTGAGTLTLGSQPPFGCYASDGTFVLTLLAHERISMGTKTAWRLVWCGPQAAQFWQDHQNTLKPDTRLQVEAHKVWAFDSKHTGMELHAQVLEMRLFGTEKSPKQNQQRAGDLIACAA